MAIDSSLKGKVFLVGAGPGDPGLITVRGRDLIQRADAIVYDHLAAPELLDYAPAKARRLYVGKKAGKHTASQDEINEILVREAKAGNAVVRLKGGDPFVFGRGAEECVYLRQCGVEFEVVPGVSAAAAVPAYAGIPVTCRDLSVSFTAITGHECESKGGAQVDWADVARLKGAIVIFMGVLNLRKIAAELVRGGKPASTPAAVIRWGTCTYQKTVTGTLETIADRVERAGLRPPALVVVGEVVRMRETLNWFETRPLFGRVILLPRARSQKSRLAALLAEMGAEVLELPAAAHELIPLPDRLEEMARQALDFDWILFPGAESVKSFFTALDGIGRDARSLARLRIGALGEETAEALRSFGVRADFLPSRFCSAAVVEELSRQFPLDGMRMLLPYEGETPEGLAHALLAAGCRVERVFVSVHSQPETGAALNGRKIDLAAFTCSAAVKAFAARLGVEEARRLAERTLFASIGPQTTMALRSFGLPANIQADPSGLPELANAIAAYYTNDADKD
ncbi:MAG: uroporphyrinogen-III C-methyltransferase [Candidatus Omnitrophota bacterium]